MDTKAAARETVGANAQTLVGLSHRVHAHPELKFEEVRTSAWTAGVLSDAGLPVDAGICDLPTAFSCRIRKCLSSLHLAICAEYGALPGMRARVRSQHHRRDGGRRFKAGARAVGRRSRLAGQRSSAPPPKRAAEARCSCSNGVRSPV